MSFETLLLSVDEGVATVTLNRPDRLNALDDTLYRELAAVIADVASSDAIGAVLLTGAGRAFCAGADVMAMRADVTLEQRRDRHHRILDTVLLPLATLPKPVIAAVNGAAAGAGFSLVLASDIVVASENALFSMAFSKIGLVPDLGSLHFLPRVVGLNKAKELCLTGARIDAAEAMRLGIVNRLVAPEQLLADAGNIARQLAAGPALALAETKALLNRSAQMTLEHVLAEETLAQVRCYGDDDYSEGVASFREKRPARFSSARRINRA